MDVDQYLDGKDALTSCVAIHGIWIPAVPAGMTSWYESTAAVVPQARVAAVLLHVRGSLAAVAVCARADRRGDRLVRRAGGRAGGLPAGRFIPHHVCARAVRVD